MKVFVENGCMFVIASGTESLMRFYTETQTPESRHSVEDDARSM